MDQVAGGFFGYFYAPFDVLRLVDAVFSGSDLSRLYIYVRCRDRGFRVFGQNFVRSDRFCETND